MPKLLLIILFFLFHVLGKAANNNLFLHSSFSNASNYIICIKDSSFQYKSIGFIKLLKFPKSKIPKVFMNGIVESAEVIDFNGDNKKDFIFKLKPDSLGIINEYWINSDFSIAKKVLFTNELFHYKWFINLDGDPEPEIIEAVGDSIAANFLVIDQNLKLGKDSVLFYFKPVFFENGKQYWSIHKNITNIIARAKGKTIQIFCSLNDTDIVKVPQILLPILFFKGKSTPNQDLYSFNKMEWLTLKEIMNKTKKQ